jgi:menaquinone-dependent protoporphyrinogen oxidase
MKITKLLIVYSSRHGHTARIAHRMADAAATIEGVQTTVWSVDDATEGHVALADLFIIAGPVHFEHHDRKLERFVREHLGVMAARSSAFASVSGQMAAFGGRPRAEELADKFLEATGWIPDRVGLFAGGIPYTRYGFILRWVMRRIASRYGLDTDTSRDYDYTDWEAVDQFAREFVTAELAASAA